MPKLPRVKLIIKHNATVPTMWFIINFVLTALTAVLVGLGLDMLRPAHLASSSNGASATGFCIPSVLRILSEFVYLSLQHFFFLPCTILIYRAMTTPYRLPWLDPQLARFVLLSNAERCSLLYVWLTPGLVEAQGLQVILLLLRWMARPELAGGDNQNATSIKRFTTDLALAIASTAILTPLEVRCAQRHTIGETKRLLPTGHCYTADDAAQVLVFRGSTSTRGCGRHGILYHNTGCTVRTHNITATLMVNLISGHLYRFPNPERPYEGLVDAGKRIVHEEGWNMLYRAWWFTMLFH